MRKRMKNQTRKMLNVAQSQNNHLFWTAFGNMRLNIRTPYSLPNVLSAKLDMWSTTPSRLFFAFEPIFPRRHAARSSPEIGECVKCAHQHSVRSLREPLTAHAAAQLSVCTTVNERFYQRDALYPVRNGAPILWRPRRDCTATACISASKWCGTKRHLLRS